MALAILAGKLRLLVAQRTERPRRRGKIRVRLPARTSGRTVSVRPVSLGSEMAPLSERGIGYFADLEADEDGAAGSCQVKKAISEPGTST